MSEIDDMFGSDSSGDEKPAKGTGPDDAGDLFGSDSDSGLNDPTPQGTNADVDSSSQVNADVDSSSQVNAGDDGDADVDPFADSDDEAGAGAISGKSLGRLRKGGGGVEEGTGKKRELAVEGKGSKGKKKKRDKLKKKKGKKRKRLSAVTDGNEEEEQQTQTVKKKKKKKKKEAEKGVDPENAQQLEDLGLLSSGDDHEEEEEEEEEADLEPVETVREDEVEAVDKEARTRADADFIDDTDDNPDILAEYTHDAPPPGSESEAEEDNGEEMREEAPAQQSAMDAVLKSMKRRKAQELSTAEREQIAQEFIYKINKASEDDEKAVKEGRPALNKLKMLKVVKATLAKKELQETFLEFDLLGVIARWLQPYKNGRIPNLTIRKEMLALLLMLPVQVDHLKRSGIGKIVMGLFNSKEETRENKNVIRELVSKWNRPVYGQDASYRAMRSMKEEPEAIEVTSSGSMSHSVRRRAGASWGHLKREDPSRDEAVGNILNAKARGLDPGGTRVPYSTGYAFAKAPRSRVESHGRQPSQQVDTSARSKLRKKMANLSRPVKKGA